MSSEEEVSLYRRNNFSKATMVETDFLLLFDIHKIMPFYYTLLSQARYIQGIIQNRLLMQK